MKRLWSIVFALLLSTSLLAFGSDPLWDKYIKAKVTFQNDLANLFAESHPQYKDVIMISRDLQVTMAHMRQRKYYYLIKTDPGKILRDQGTTQWADFAWTAEDNQKLLDIDPEYVGLTRSKRDLKEKNQRHPDWPAVRNAFVELMKKPDYKNIHQTLMDSISEIDRDLKKTKQSRL